MCRLQIQLNSLNWLIEKQKCVRSRTSARQRALRASGHRHFRASRSLRAGAPAVPANRLSDRSPRVRGGPCPTPETQNRESKESSIRGSGLIMIRDPGLRRPGSQLHSVWFFLQKLHRHYPILFESTIEFAAIDSQRGGRADLIAAELLQHRKDVAFLNLSQRNALIHIGLENAPKIDSTRMGAIVGDLYGQISQPQLLLGTDSQRISNRIL